MNWSLVVKQDSKIKFGVISSFRIHVFSFLNKIFYYIIKFSYIYIYNEGISQLTLKIYNSEEHLVVSILSFSQTPKYETQQ